MNTNIYPYVNNNSDNYKFNITINHLFTLHVILNEEKKMLEFKLTSLKTTEKQNDYFINYEENDISKMQEYPHILNLHKQLNSQSHDQKYTIVYIYFWQYFSGRNSTSSKDFTYKWGCYLVNINDNINTYEFRFINVIPNKTLFININFDTKTKTSEISNFLIK